MNLQYGHQSKVSTQFGAIGTRRKWLKALCGTKRYPRFEGEKVTGRRPNHIEEIPQSDDEAEINTQHELRRNLSFVNADIYQYSLDLHQCATALEAIVSEDECSLEVGHALAHLSAVSFQRIHKLLTERTEIVTGLARLKVGARELGA